MEEWDEAEFASVLLIRHSDGKESGTGFAVWSDEKATWLVTCAHVIDTRGGATLLVRNLRAEVVADGRAKERSEKVDLAVLKVPGLRDIEPLPLVSSQDPGPACRIPGWSEYGGSHRGLCLEARLGRAFPLTEDGCLIARSWPVEIQGQHLLKKGYSGAPVIRAVQGTVFAVAAMNEDEGRAGTAICISHLQDIWPDMPADLLGAVTDVDLDADLQRRLTRVFERLPDGVALSDLRAVCMRSAPSGLPLDWPAGDDPAVFRHWLFNKPKLSNDRLLLYDVLAFLAPKVKQDELLRARIGESMHQIRTYYSRHFHLDTTPLPEDSRAVDMAARVEVIFENRLSAQNNGFNVRSRWRLPGKHQPEAGAHREPGGGGQLNLDDEEATAEFIGELMDHLGAYGMNSEQVMFEFVLPNELLLQPVEHWWQDPISRVPLGRDFPVVVRSGERLSKSRYWPHWEKVWERLKPHLQNEVSHRLWCAVLDTDVLEPTALAGVCDEVEQGRCVALARVPDLSVPARANLLLLVILRGASVVLWPRDPEAEPKFCSELEKAFQGQPLEAMPRLLRKLRATCFGREKPNPTHKHVTLLWDDPSRSAPERHQRQFKMDSVATPQINQAET